MEGCQDLCQMWDEAVVKIDHSKETLKLHLSLGKGHVRNRVHFLRKGNNPGRADGVSKESDGLGTKSALGAVDLEARGRQPREDGPQIIQVAGRRGAGD